MEHAINISNNAATVEAGEVTAAIEALAAAAERNAEAIIAIAEMLKKLPSPISVVISDVSVQNIPEQK